MVKLQSGVILMFNRITFEQVYTKTFKCTYQLQLYPFDTQVYLPSQYQWRLSRCVLWTWLWGSWRRWWWRSPPTSSPWSQRRCSPSIWSPTGPWLTTTLATWTQESKWRLFWKCARRNRAYRLIMDKQVLFYVTRNESRLYHYPTFLMKNLNKHFLPVSLSIVFESHLICSTKRLELLDFTVS